MDSDIYNLGDICSITKGQQINSEFLSEQGEFYVMNGGIEPSGYYSQSNTPPNTISISEGGNSCGYVQYNKSAFWSGGHCYTLESPTINTLYLFHYLKAMETDIMNLRIGSGLPNIQKKDLYRFEVKVPSEKLQMKVSKMLDTLLQKIECEEQITINLIKQKQHLLKTLFI